MLLHAVPPFLFCVCTRPEATSVGIWAFGSDWIGMLCNGDGFLPAVMPHMATPGHLRLLKGCHLRTECAPS